MGCFSALRKMKNSRLRCSGPGAAQVPLGLSNLSIRPVDQAEQTLGTQSLRFLEVPLLSYGVTRKIVKAARMAANEMMPNIMYKTIELPAPIRCKEISAVHTTMPNHNGPLLPLPLRQSLANIPIIIGMGANSQRKPHATPSIDSDEMLPAGLNRRQSKNAINPTTINA